MFRKLKRTCLASFQASKGAFFSVRRGDQRITIVRLMFSLSIPHESGTEAIEMRARS